MIIPTEDFCSSSTLGSACDEAEDVADWAKGNSAWNVDNHNNNSAEWDEDCRHYLAGKP